MNVIKTNIQGIVIIEPCLFKTQSGYFFESFSKREFEEKVSKVNFCQDNESMSSYGVVRGFHFQRPPFAQSKLMWCVEGKAQLVVIDIRKGSPTYGKTLTVELSAENHRQLFVPKGFAHGYSVLSEKAIIQYKCDNFYHPECEDGISIKDKHFNIDWKIEDRDIKVSDKDMKFSSFEYFDSPFVY